MLQHFAALIHQATHNSSRQLAATLAGGTTPADQSITPPTTHSPCCRSPLHRSRPMYAHPGNHPAWLRASTGVVTSPCYMSRSCPSCNVQKHVYGSFFARGSLQQGPQAEGQKGHGTAKKPRAPLCSPANKALCCNQARHHHATI